MSACDRRTYYPTPNGLFKLRKSDGDLAWECRPISHDAAFAATYRNLGVRRLADGRLIVIGPYDDPGYDVIMKARMVTESGNEIALVEETVSVDAPVAGFTTGAMHSRVSVTADYIYLSGQETGTPDNGRKVITKFNISDGMFVEQRTFTNSGNLNGFNALEEELIDVFHGAGVTQSIKRYDGLNSAMLIQSDPIGFSLNVNGQMIQDDYFYYMGNVTAAAKTWTKVSKADLSTVAQSAETSDTKQGTGEVRDGLLVSPVTNSVLCYDTDLVLVFDANTGGLRPLTASVCSSFAVAAMVGDSAHHPGTATSYKIRRYTLTGVMEWEVEILSSEDRDLEWELWPRIRISADESHVYFYGSVSHNGLASTDLKMALYVLDAATGDVVWCFSPGPTIDFFGSNSHAGLSLLEEDEYLYLSTLRCRAPTYR
jgi:outer membrane protein assembly factor BamB